MIFDYEIIIVDDGSTDSTGTILKNYSSKYNNINVITNTNHGVSYSRNIGIKHAKGEYLLFVDSDDLLSEKWDKIMKDSIENATDDLIIFNQNYDKENCSDSNEIIRDILNTKKYNYYLSTPWSKLYKRKIVLNNNIKFDEEIINGEDLLFNINFLTYVKHFKIINKKIYIYRLTPNSLTKNFNKKILKSDLKYIDELNKVLSKTNIKDLNQIVQSEKYNGLYLILVRISTNLSFPQALDQIKSLDLNFYNFKSELNNLGKFKKIILILFKNKKYKLMLVILKIKKISINLKNTKEKMIEI